jgi:CheY-like chemotaxis protein
MLENYSILIVDDSYADRYLLKRFLSKIDLELTILEATSGGEALELLKSPLDALEAQYPAIRAPITLFLDINMPVMSGWDFLDELDKCYDEVQLKPSVVVMYTTSDAEIERSRAKEYAQVADYLTKDNPTPDKLKEVILACHS